MRPRTCFIFSSMIKPSGLLLPLLLALIAPRASGATFLGFNTGPFYSIVGTTDTPTVPTVLQVLFDGPVLTDTFVSITSSDLMRLSISGGGVTLLAGQSSAVVLVSSFTPGDVTVTGYFQATVATNTVSVVSEVPIIPHLNIELVAGAARLTWTTNAPGYLLETNIVLSNPSGWGVLTSNYSILNTNFVATNAISSAARFYRLHKP
jgi:hypothetical protein